jgi:hypothetical protein
MTCEQNLYGTCLQAGIVGRRSEFKVVSARSHVNRIFVARVCRQGLLKEGAHAELRQQGATRSTQLGHKFPPCLCCCHVQRKERRSELLDEGLPYLFILITVTDLAFPTQRLSEYTALQI